MISIKITGLLDMRVLKKWNQSVELRDSFWAEHSKDGHLTYQQLAAGLAKIDQQITHSDINNYLKQVHNFEGPAEQFRVGELDFKVNHQPYYLFAGTHNANKVVCSFSKFEPSDLAKLQAFVERLKLIC